jgi:cephalosporin-C deacetylase
VIVMALFDLPLPELREYRLSRPEPAGFEDFWAVTLATARRLALPPKLSEVSTPLSGITTWDVTFTGYSGQPVRAWLNRPSGADGPLPVAVEFIGYGGGRGLPIDWLVWASAGYAHLVMDTRGQGGSWRGGDTPDPDDSGAGPSTPGFLTRGVLDPETFYYRRLITDAVRAVETAAELPGVDASRLVVTGKSQGGALALAAGGLVPDLVSAVVAGVPFLCDIQRAVTITDSDPYAEVVRFLRANPRAAERTLRTLDHVDAVHFARRITAPSILSAALMDDVCPPSGVFAAYNAIQGQREIEVYPWDDHAGGRSFFDTAALEFVDDRLS